MSLFEYAPRIAAAMFLSSQKERVSLMDALCANSRLGAAERMASTLLRLHERLTIAGMVDNQGFDMPLTQERVADIVGLTSVHVNRTIKELTGRGLISWNRSRITIHDLDGLWSLAGMRPRTFVDEPVWFPRVRHELKV